MTEHSFQGIAPSPSGRKCHPCVRYEMSPMSQAAHSVRTDTSVKTKPDVVVDFLDARGLTTRLDRGIAAVSDPLHGPLLLPAAERSAFFKEKTKQQTLSAV